MATELEKQVTADIDKVKAVRSRALAALQGKMFQTTEVTAAINGIRSIPIDAWAKRGLDAAAAGKPPSGASSWAGWKTAGEEHMRGVDAIHDIGETGTLADIVATAKDVKKDAGEVVRKVAKAGGQAVGAVAAPALPLVALLAVALVAAVILVRK